MERWRGGGQRAPGTWLRLEIRGQPDRVVAEAQRLPEGPDPARLRVERHATIGGDEIAAHLGEKQRGDPRIGKDQRAGERRRRDPEDEARGREEASPGRGVEARPGLT